MSRLPGRSQNRESQETSPEGAGAAFQRRCLSAVKVRPRLIGLLLALITLLVYLPTAHFAFIRLDDNTYVTENSYVQAGLTWTGLRWAFTTWHTGNWHPLTWLSLMLDCQLFGVDAGALHIVNALFHAANTALVFALLLRLTGKLWPAAFVAALFGWHPLHVESVAWISERKDVLSTFFGLLALLAYARYAQNVAVERPSPHLGQAGKVQVTGKEAAPTPVWSRATCHRSPFYWLALFFFALGLMSKPMLVTLPFVLLLLDYWPLQRFAGFGLKAANPPNRHLPVFNLRLLTEKWPFFLFAAASCVVTFLAQRHASAVIPFERFPLDERLGKAFESYTGYLLKMIWPTRLCIFYPLHLGVSPASVLLAVAVLLLISAGAWLMRRRSPCLIVGWLWFLGTLVPVIGLVQVGGAAMADRYTYFPSIGIFSAVAFGVGELAKRFQFPKGVVPAAAILVLAACMVLARKQLSYWRNNETVFRHASLVTKDNSLALVNLGEEFEVRGQFDRALSLYSRAVRITPGSSQAHYDLGSVLDKLGRTREALSEFSQAERLQPDDALTRLAAGEALAELGRFGDALNEYANAAQLDPAYALPHFEMAKVLLAQGRGAKAIGQFREALRLDPTNAYYLAYTARVLAADTDPNVRNGRAALLLADKACAVSGGQPFALDALGMACAELDRFDDAQRFAQKALDLATAAKMNGAAELQQRLQLYKHHQPWRESFLVTNAPVKN